MAKFEIDQIGNPIPDLNTEWNGHPGIAVEDFVTRQIEKAQNQDITSLDYNSDGQNSLVLHKADGSTVSTTITVEVPTNRYGIMIYGVMLDNDSSKIYTSGNLLMQYNSDKNVKVGIAMFAIAQTTFNITNMVGPFDVKITFGSQSKIYKVNNIKYEDCILDGSTGQVIGVEGTPEEIVDKISWIDITDLFTKAQTKKQINAVVQASGDSNLLDLSITNEVISLSYTGDIVTSTNSAQFSITGGTASNYYLEVYNNGNNAETTSGGVLIYSGLHAGLNQLAVRAIHSSDINIYSDFIYVDIICTVDCQDTVVALNGVSSRIANNGVATLYELTVYSPQQENVELTTYLESQQVDEINPQPTEIMKYEVLKASSYNDENQYKTSYKKYIEVVSDGTNMQLLVKVNSTFYSFYEMEKLGTSYQPYKYLFKLMTIDQIDNNLTYFQDVAPNYNFDQIHGYINNIFITEEYANDVTPATVISDLESSDGWSEDEGRAVFKVSAQSKPILKNPLRLNLSTTCTIEMGIKTYNISDKNQPILTIGNFQLRPTQFCWNTEDNDLFNARNAQFREGVETHLTITVHKGWVVSKDDIYYPNFLQGNYQDQYDNLAPNTPINLVRIYINGVIDREINLLDTEINSLSTATLQINPTTADINFYLFRVYNNVALNFSQVQRNYISFLASKEDKVKFFEKNDILGQNGEISFEKCYEKYNTLVYVFPKKGKFPHRAWGGEDGSAESGIDKKLATTLFVTYADPTKNAQYGGRLTHGQVKGQGSSAMRYLIWNVTYALNKLKYKNSEGVEKKIKSTFTPYSQMDPETKVFKEAAASTSGYYCMPPYDVQKDITAYKYTKMVGKVNFASSMQSHKIGACKLYDDAYKQTIGVLPSGGRKAVHEEPFLYFYWESDYDYNSSVDGYNNPELSPIIGLNLADLLNNNDQIKFMGFQTWGPGKGDDACSGYDEDITPEYLMLEGGENTEPTTNFRIPWQELQRGTGELGTATYTLGTYPTISYSDSLERPWDNLLIDDESIVHTTRGAWDIDYGVKEFESASKITYFQFAESVHNSLKKFRAFYDFVYTHDFNLVTSNATSPQDNWDVTKKYVITSNQFSANSTGHKTGDIYRYDTITKAWIKAGVSYDSATGWARANIYELTGVGSGKLQLALDTLKQQFKEGITQYINKEDVAFHQAFVKFLSGTDNRAKNTYFQIIGPIYEKQDNGSFIAGSKGDYSIRLIGDDLDTILVTDNNGLQSKPYNLLETSYDETMKEHWGDANNIFFYMFDQCFESDIKVYLQKIINHAELDRNNILADTSYFYKTFFDVQDNMPAVAFNHTAKIYYENAQSIYNSKVLSYYGNNNIQPIEQSHGSCLQCEAQFLKERLDFLAGYALESLGTEFGTASSAGSGDSLILKMKFTPYQDFYPTMKWESAQNLAELESSNYDCIKYRAKAGQSYSVQVVHTDTAINQGLYQTSLYKDLSIIGLKRSVLDADFSRVTDFYIDNDALTDKDHEYYSSIFGTNYPQLSLASITASFPVLQNLTLRNMNLPEELDLSTYLKLESIDLYNTTTKNVIFPQTGRLKNVILPNSIEIFRIYDNPGLTDIVFQGLDHLKTVFIDCNNVGSFNVANFCEELINCNALESVTIRNAKLYITEEALRKLIYTKTCNLTGDIYIVTSAGGTTLKAINFSTKQLLVNTFGDISSTGSTIRMHFQSAEILDFSCASEVSVYYQAGESGTIVRQNMFDITVDSGNDVNIKSGTNPFNPSVNGYLDITYSMSGVSSDVATIDQTGAITLKKESTATAIVTISMKVANSSTAIRKTSTVSFTWKAPQLGDFAYADGTFSSAYDSNKTMIGLVYAKDETTSTSGTVYIIGKEYSDPDQSYYLGYTNDGVDGSNTEILAQLYQVSQYLSEISVSNYESVPGIAEYTPIDNINVNTYTIQSNATFKGDTDTIAYIDHVNNNILPILYNNNNCKPYISRKQVAVGGSTNYVYYIESLQNLKDLCEATKGLYSNTSGTDIMSCILFPYFYSMNVYEPATKSGETLNAAYQKGNWYAPSAAELSRIIYYRGYSVSGSNFNTGDVVRNAISTTVANGGGILTTPIFSLAYSRAKNQFPTVWSNIVGSGTDAGPNNITTTVNTTEANNYSYQRTQTYSGSDYVYSNTWVVGSYNDTSYWNTTQYNNAWRLTKHQGVPFTKFNYSKNG